MPPTTTPAGKASWLDRAVSWGLGLLPAALGGFAALSLATAIVVPLVKIAKEGQSAGWSAGLLYLLGAGFSAWLLKKADRWSENRVVFGMLVLGIALKAAVALLVPRLPFNIDQSLFHHFAASLASDAYGEATLASLSAYYDYPLWAGRIFPVHYFLERWSGPQAWAWSRILNVLAATLILCLTHALARRVLPPGKRKWAVFLLLALPFQTFWVTDYSHHLYSSLYLLAFAWAAWELAFGGKKGPRQIAFSALASVCLLCMAWHGGVDWIAAGTAAALVVLHLLTHRDARQSARLALLSLVIPLTVAATLKGPLLMDRIHACDAYRQNSVLPAFMARGWCPGTGGEYTPRYEQLDRATPWPQKPKAMFRLIASQIHHEPLKTCFWLPCVKTAKLFLVGYASNLEESLAVAQSPALPRVNWLRRSGAVFFLLFVCAGSIRLACAKRIPATWIPVLLVPLLTWGAYVLGGETSPRYSVFCQPFLAIIGGFVFCGEPFSAPAARTWLSRTLFVLLFLLAAAGILASAIRLLPSTTFYEDLRGNRDGATTRTGPFPVFERTVVLPPGTESVSMDWPVPDGAVACSFYPIQCRGDMEGVSLALGPLDDPPFAVFPVEKRALPKYEETPLPPGTRTLRFTVSRAPDAMASEGSLDFGYLLWSVP